MLDRLKQLAVKLQPARTPALLLALACLGGVAFTLLIIPQAGDRFLIPLLALLLWSLSAYALITTFRAIPSPPATDAGLLQRHKRGLHRAWYWLLALVFLAATVAVLRLTFRLISIWLRAYG